jgi:uncharacterized iron-regulated membrane protein
MRRSVRPPAALIWFHRWLGTATCLIFAAWFASGAVLVFKDFPSLSRDDRVALQRPVDLDAVAIGPARALAAAGSSAAALRLIQRGAAPAYIVEGGERAVAVDARSGDLLAPLPPSSGASQPIEYDQWIVHNQFDTYRPLYRTPQGDRAGTVLYTSAMTGEPVQRTNAWDRAWNWAGAVLHWIYFTPLRSSYTAWDQAVWWLSLVAMLVAIAGSVIGIMRAMVALRQRPPSLSFFRQKWMRWHHILGLFTAIFVIAWIFSGWLSMDHGRLFSRGQPTEAQEAAYRGGSLESVLAAVSPETLTPLGSVKRIDFHAVGGSPLLTVLRSDGRVERVDGAGETLDEGAITTLVGRGVRMGWPGGSAGPIEAVDPTAMYALAEGWPHSTLRVPIIGGRHPDLYIDGDNGQILTIMDDSRSAYAWSYYALHTFNFPGLTTRPVLRQVIVLIPLAIGFVFSLTGVVIGWRRLRASI